MEFNDPLALCIYVQEGWPIIEVAYESPTRVYYRFRIPRKIFYNDRLLVRCMKDLMSDPCDTKWGAYIVMAHGPEAL